MDEDRDQETGESAKKDQETGESAKKNQETGESAKKDQESKLKDIPYEATAGSSNSPNLGASAMFPSVIPSSPPSVLTLEQICKAAEDLNKYQLNMELAHEIAVNKDFKLHRSTPKTNLEEKVTEMFHKAFWDLLTEQLSRDPPEYTQAMVLLKEIKEILLYLLLPHSARLKNEINEVLDIELIEQQTKKEVIDVLSYAQFIISTMSRICAPVRDTNIQELRQLTEIVPLYRDILKTLDLMKLDMANFTISRLRPHIEQHSVDYEQAKFRHILQSLESLTPPVDGLKFTRLWLQTVYDEVVVDVPEPAKSLVLKKAYLKILKWKEAEHFPETLHLDHERFISLTHDLTVMVLTATVILATFSIVGKSIHGLADFKSSLTSHIQILLADAPQCSAKELETKMENVGMQVVKEVNECLVSHGYPTSHPEIETSLVVLIKFIADEDHTPRVLVTKRILGFLELAIGATSSVKIPPGLSSLKNELSRFAGQFLSLVKHNQAVFEEYYYEIIEQWKSTK